MVHSEWILEIWGTGGQEQMLKKHIVESGLDGKVFLKGFTANLYGEMTTASIYLMTSEFEGFGLVLVEAMAFGCVPIALGSYPAVYDVIANDCGIIVPVPYDENRFAMTVKSVMDDEKMRSVMSENGVARAGMFAVKAVVDRYETLFAKLGCHA